VDVDVMGDGWWVSAGLRPGEIVEGDG
jgi:hypothetical protein